MAEFEGLTPREATTGLFHTPCLVFGNGVEIETSVYAKTTQESEHLAKDGRTIRVLPIRLGDNLQGTDVVKIHFIPKTSLAERANDPLLVSEDEKPQIAMDCLTGFIALAHALRDRGVEIKDHRKEDDFYLFADTNFDFAEFLRKNCGFRGTDNGDWVWIRKNEFASDGNITKMTEALSVVKQKISPDINSYPIVEK